MLIGDPRKFAIWFDSVESWSDERFRNGCFSYFIGGEIIFSTRSTIDVDINGLRNFSCLKNSIENELLFNLSACQAYDRLYEITFPSIESGNVNDFSYYVTTESLSDDGYSVFLVEFESKAKLIFGRAEGVGNIGEFFLDRGEFQLVVSKVLENKNDLMG
ncbi:immunity 42 family protein [Burkholderia plantarii]|uniref:immunity 42 family protein n=1 Tax=Burkholderia plantarii TaxID=41899 RepID=UPI0018DB3130|nr:immunity 42 family protein [Burkholderia plantarii]MBI0329327.1 immunity 42 family protein [Burkholderia plantarii]